MLAALQANRFTINPIKCKWNTQESGWLGYWLTPNVLKHWHKKIEAIIHMYQPKNLKKIPGFLGAVKFYRYMWHQQEHILNPLSTESGKKYLHWTYVMSKEFLQMKAILS